MKCIVLAGGLGTRVRHISGSLPKALIPVEGVPFVALQMRLLASAGVTRVIYSIGDKGDQIRRFFDDIKFPNLTVELVEDGPVLLGTGGAVRRVVDTFTDDEPFLLTYGDSYLPIDFAAVYAAFQKRSWLALMTVLKNDGQWDSSNCHFSNDTVPLYSKKGAPDFDPSFNYIDYGLLVLRPGSVRESIPSGEATDLGVYLNALSRSGTLGGYEVHDRFYEIGSETGIADFEAYVRRSGLAYGPTQTAREKND